MSIDGNTANELAMAQLGEILQKSMSKLTHTAREAMETELPWFTELPAQERSWLGLVAQESMNRFIIWLKDPEHASTAASDIFRVAPPELARAISLQNTVAVIRLLVSVVERHAHELVPRGHVDLLVLAALLYSREVAFSAAEVYARAAESRGAWDARQESLAIDAIVRGAPDETLRSRVATLGWSGQGKVAVVIATSPGRPGADHAVAQLRQRARSLTSDALVGTTGERLIVVLGGVLEPASAARELLTDFPAGPVVIGPTVADIAKAGRSARCAQAGMLAVGAWSKAPRPVNADDLLPERMLNGDPLARHTLVSEIYEPLRHTGTALLETLDEYLAQGRSLEGAARELYVHPNTVRYRLRRIAEVVGWDPTDAREGFVLQTALTAGRLAQSAQSASYSGS